MSSADIDQFWILRFLAHVKRFQLPRPVDDKQRSLHMFY